MTSFWRFLFGRKAELSLPPEPRVWMCAECQDVPVRCMGQFCSVACMAGSTEDEDVSIWGYDGECQ